MQNRYQLRRERKALLDWAMEQRFTHALTLNTDRELNERRLDDIFGCFCHRYDKAIHGRNLKRVPLESRLNVIAFPENLSTNAHLHAFVDLSPAIEAFGNDGVSIERLRTCWLQSTRGAGSVCLVAQPDRRWGGYCTKRFNGNYLLSADYWPK